MDDDDDKKVTILHRMPTEEEISELKEIFHLIDTDGSGDIDRDELGELMKLLGFNPSQEELDLMISEVDMDQNGSIEIDEFIQVLTQQDVEVMYTPAEFKEACESFCTYAEKEAGVINSQTLVDALKTFPDENDNKASDEYINDIMVVLDHQKKGFINFHRFISMMKNS